MRGHLDYINSKRVGGNISAVRRRILWVEGIHQNLVTTQDFVSPVVPTSMAGLWWVRSQWTLRDWKPMAKPWGCMRKFRCTVFSQPESRKFIWLDSAILQRSVSKCPQAIVVTFPLGYAHQSELLPGAFPVWCPTDVLSAEWPLEMSPRPSTLCPIVHRAVHEVRSHPAMSYPPPWIMRSCIYVVSWRVCICSFLIFIPH